MNTVTEITAAIRNHETGFGAIAPILKHKECGIQITKEILEDVLSDDGTQEDMTLFEEERSQAAIPEEEWPPENPGIASA